MIKKIYTLVFCFSLLSSSVLAQVNQIKSASSSNNSRRGSGERSSSSGSGSLLYMALDLTVRGLYSWQMNTLPKRGQVPNVLSLEMYGQVAVQPSTYYVFNPRIRGNWGIFLTDFRMNYMLEEKIGKPADLRTDDWQVLGLNVINTRMVTARISTGVMHEAFGEGNIFSESVFGLSVNRPDQKMGGTAEFRTARDYQTWARPRIEGSLFFQRQLFEHGHKHLYATAGITFQRYYSSIDVWGMQGGFLFKLY